MLSRKFLLLKIVILIPVLTGWAIYRGLLPSWPLRILELIVYAFLVAILIKRKSFPGITWILLSVLVWLFSTAVNNTSFVLLLFFIRSMLLYFIIAVYISGEDANEGDLIELFRYVWIILLLQIPIAIIKYFTIGFGETPLGLCGTSWTTFIFLIGTSYAFSFYLFTRQKRYLSCILGFVVFGLAGGKRAIVFMFPVLLLFLVIIYNYRSILKFKIILPLILLISIVVYSTVRFLPTLNPENKIGGSFNLSYLLEYTSDYNTAKTRQMGAIGRVSALEMALKKLSEKGKINLLIGNGAGILTKTSIEKYDNRNVVKEKYDIGYGVTALVFLLIQVGIVGALAYFLFIVWLGRFSWHARSSETEDFWKAFHLGTIGLIFSFSVIAFFYDVIHKEPVVMTLTYTLIGISIARHKMICSNYTEAQPIQA